MGEMPEQPELVLADGVRFGVQDRAEGLPRNPSPEITEEIKGPTLSSQRTRRQGWGNRTFPAKTAQGGATPEPRA